MIYYSQSFQKTHNIRTLLDLLPSDIETPDQVEESAILSDFAVESRYPGDVEAVTIKEYQKAIEMAEYTFFLGKKYYS